MKLTFVTALENAKNGAMRVVFGTANGNAVVLKTSGPDAPVDLQSVKVWSLISSGLKETMSYWNAVSPVESTELGIGMAGQDIRRIMAAAIGCAL